MRVGISIGLPAACGTTKRTLRTGQALCPRASVGPAKPSAARPNVLRFIRRLPRRLSCRSALGDAGARCPPSPDAGQADGRSIGLRADRAGGAMFGGVGLGWAY
jgi:hypothetical protein